MAALDSLDDVERNIQEAAHVIVKSKVVAEAVRSRHIENPQSSADKTHPSPPAPRTPSNVKFLSITKLAERWGCCTRTVIRMIDRGTLKRTCLGARTIRIDIEDIERYEANARS